MTDDPLIGRQLGNYIVRARLGSGGMGAVYLAEHPQIKRQVAIKVLAPHLALTPGLGDRFVAEATAASRVEHPNVITIFDFGRTEDGQLYQVMELLRGRELAHVIAERAPLAPAEIVPYAEQICGALQAAHEMGVVHRDLKPENIFVLAREPLTIKILDFGLAKLLEPGPENASLTATGMVMGSPLTIAPEQAAGQRDRVSPRTDLYSLGVILYWMLAGRPPFSNEPTAVLLAQHIANPPPPLAEVAAWVPAAVTEVVHRCLEKDPARRPVSALELGRVFCAAASVATCAPPPRRQAAVSALAPTEAPLPTDAPIPSTRIAPTAAKASPPFAPPAAALAGWRPITTLQGAAGEHATPPGARSRTWPIVAVTVVVIAGGSAAYWLSRPTSPPAVPPRAPVAQGTVDARSSGAARARSADRGSAPVAVDCDGLAADRPCLAPQDRAFNDTGGGAGWGDRCVVHLRANKLGWAKAACDRGLALAAAPRLRGALQFNLGLVAERAGDLETAKLRYRESLASRPGNTAVQDVLAKLEAPGIEELIDLSRTLARTEERARALLTAGAPRAEVTRKLNRRGMLHYKKRRWTEAAAAFELAHRLDPSAELPIWNRACSAGLLKDAATAASWLEKLKTLGTPAATKYLGWAKTDKDLNGVRDDPALAPYVR